MGSFGGLLVGMILVLAAGCTGAGAGEKSSVEPQSEVNVQQGSSSIIGTIVDAEIMPLEGAKVQVRPKGALDSSPLELVTNASGKFLADGLQPGEYNVFASKVGYREPKSQAVVIEQGSQTRVDFVLDRLRVQEPFHESFHYQTAFVGQACAIAPGSASCFGIQYSYNNPYNLAVDESKTGLLETLVVEMKWTPSISACSGGMRSEVFSPQATAFSASEKTPKNPFYWDNLPNVKTPTRLLIQRAGEEPAAMFSPARLELNGGTPIATTGKWKVFNFHNPVGILGTPVDVACMYATPIDIWLTAFYVTPAPAPDWSIFRSG